MRISKLIFIALLIPLLCFAGRLDNRLFQSGTATITTDKSGNGTVTVTFPTAFTNAPEVLVVEPLYNVKGIYGVKNSYEIALAKGKQPMGGITTYASGAGGSSYTKCTSISASTGTITTIGDNKDGKTKCTDAAHGLNYGTVINIFNSDTAKVNGYFSIVLNSFQAT